MSESPFTAQTEARRTPDGSVGASSRSRTIGSVALIVTMLVIVTALHLTTAGSTALVPLHLIYRRMYLIPIIYAAWTFGRRGGLLVAFAASLPFALHAQMVLNAAMGGIGFDNWIEIASFFALGFLFGLARDIEERRAQDLEEVSAQLTDAYKKLEERAIQLITVQDYTASILRSITSAVLTVGPDGSVATANPAAERMLAMSEYEMVPKAIGSLFTRDGGLSDDVAKVLAGRIPIALREAALTTTNGLELSVQMSTSRMRAVGGTVLGAVITLEDVSEVRALTDQLIRADRLAAMGQLTAGVAHEIRNPLGVIRASVQLLDDSRCDERRIHEASEVIKHEIDRLDKVIKALLDFGRPSKPTLMRTDLADILADVVLFTTRFAGQSNVSISFADPGVELPVMCDPDQLKQVFLNLVTNAVQAMKGIGGEISITAMIDGDYVSVAVRDTGPGISENDLNKVFDPFFTKRAEGTGLGLTIVHRIIDQHDGHIEVSSGPDGTTFTVSLPMAYEE